jgi:hypothetical protein
MTDSYTLYYLQQAEGRYGGSFHSATMKGDGLGSFLGGLFRRIFPLLSSGAKAVGKQALSTGVGLLKDALNGRPIKESMFDQVSKAGNNLTDLAAKRMEKMVGNGYKGVVKKRKRQSRSASKRSKTTKKRSQAKDQLRDIFG